ncbi:MAG: N-acetylmuramoyl-L-alanine amidase family protein [Bacillota bacterium]
MVFLLRRRLLIGLVMVPFFCLGSLWGRSLARKTAPIAIDPGHGGIDGGCQDGRGNLEKDLNLALALLVAENLRQKGHPVYLTREDDRDLGPTYRQDLLARVEKARAHGACLMVSLHANWSYDPAAAGALALVPPASFQSELLAKAILLRLRAVCPVTPAPIPRSDHALLAAAPFPIALVEVGFLSNPQEAARLQDPSYRRAIARAIADGIEDYLARRPGQPLGLPPKPLNGR